jgi:CBS domain containing-hemolysin-like protein
MINRVLDLQSLTVRQAVTPLHQAATVTTQTSLGQALALCRDRGVNRLPVLETRDRQQRVVGLLSLKTVLFQEELDLERPVSAYLKPALYLEEDLRLEVALRRMQRSGQRLGIVLGRERREIGVISLPDVLKVIFGEVSL